MDLKGKKIACFVALAHHTRFLLPITDQAVKKGAEVVYFLPLSDYPFERELSRMNYPYRFIQDYIGDTEKVKIKKSYQNFMDDWATRFGNWDGLRSWPLFEQERSVSSCIEECFGVEKFIEVEKPDVFLALHERNRWGKIIGHYANKAGIPYLTLQEGDYHESRLSFSAHTEFSTANLLWGEATRDILVEHLCSDDKIVLVGNTHLDTAVKQNTKPKKLQRIRSKFKIDVTKKNVLVLVDLEYGAILEPRIWEMFLSGVPDGIRLIFKWHPNVKRHTYLQIEKMILEIDKSVMMMYTQDPYELLAVSDYCVTLGKTTLALEAVAFGKPLFACPSWTSKQEYYVDKGVAQAIKPLGNWENLERTIEQGVPEALNSSIQSYLAKAFHRIDGRAVMRVLEILEYMVDKKRDFQQLPNTSFEFLQAKVPGRVSIIVPTGCDDEAFIGTIRSLASYVKFDDWELIVVNHDSEMNDLLAGLDGDLTIVQGERENLSELYNLGAQKAQGEILLFMQPGIMFACGDGIPELAGQGLVAVPINTVEGAAYCHGISFDFNYAPYPIKDNNTRVMAAGGGVLAMSREHFILTGGFDQTLDSRYAEIDLSLTARQMGIAIVYAYADQFVHYKQSIDINIDNNLWQGRVGFFAKWVGRLPKNDNYLKFAEKLLAVG